MTRAFICAKCRTLTSKEMWGIRLFMRHGKTDMNLQNVCIGSIDEPLNDLGRDQAKESAYDFLGKEQIPDLIITSNLSRASETAAIFAKTISYIKPLIRDPRLKERHVGVIQGKPETLESDAQLFRHDFLPPGATPLHDFESETQNLLKSCISFSAEKILMVTHSFRMMTIIKLIKGLSIQQIMDYPVPKNCQIIRFGVAGPCTCGSFFYEKTE